MAQHFKYNTGSTINNTTQKGNISIAISGDQDWGPTDITGFYPETTAPASGYTIYSMRVTGGPSVHVANNDEQAIFFLKSFGSTGSTISDVLSWASAQGGYYVQTGSTESVTPTPTPTITDTPTPTPTPTIEPTTTPTPTITPTASEEPATPTPTITDTPTPTPTPTPASALQYYYGTTEAEAAAMTNGLSNFSFSYGQTDFCYQYGITFTADEITGLTGGVTYYVYDSVSGAARTFTILGSGYNSANASGACSYQYGRYRASATANGVCTNFTGFITSEFRDSSYNISDFCNGNSFQTSQLTGLTSGSFYVYDTVTDNVRMITNGFSGNTMFYFSGSCSTNDCVQYVYADTEIGTCTSTSGLTNVNLYGNLLCNSNEGSSISSDTFSGLTSGMYYIRDKFTEYVRAFYLYGGSSFGILSGATCTTICTTGRTTGYYIGATADEAVTGGTESFYVAYSPTGYTLCTAGSFSGTSLSSLSAGTYYLYDGSVNKYRDFTIYSPNSTSASFMGGACATPAGGARSGYYFATSRPAAITGGTQVGDVTFSGGSNDLCSCTSATSNTLFSALSGTIYIYNADTGDVRQFYGNNQTQIYTMGSCLNTNTPVYYYSTSPNDCYAMNALSNVYLLGGNEFCSATGFGATELSSLGPNTYYIRDVFTDNFRSFYCAYNGSVSFTNSCTQYSCL
jgi:hypothetical protein